jgi:hypothetical protein
MGDGNIAESDVYSGVWELVFSLRSLQPPQHQDFNQQLNQHLKMPYINRCKPYRYKYIRKTLIAKTFLFC